MNYSQTRLLVDDMAACVRFYRDILGLKLLTGGEADGYSAFWLRDDVELALFSRAAMAEALGGTPAPLGGDVVLLNFMVDDVEAVAARLAEQGVALAGPVTDRPDWGLRTIHLRDPQGVLVEIAQGLPMPH